MKLVCPNQQSSYDYLMKAFYQWCTDTCHALMLHSSFHALMLHSSFPAAATYCSHSFVPLRLYRPMDPCMACSTACFPVRRNKFNPCTAIVGNEVVLLASWISCYAAPKKQHKHRCGQMCIILRSAVVTATRHIRASAFHKRVCSTCWQID